MPEGLAQSQRAALLQAVATQMEEVLAQIEDLQNRTESVSPDNAIGRLTRLEAIQAQGVQSTQIRALKQRLSLLQQVMPRLQSDPEYGICQGCGETIALARLQSLPYVAMCATCADEFA